MNIANLKIGKRLALGFGTICVLLVFILGFSITMLGRVNEGTHEIVNDRMPKVEMSYNLNMGINDIAISLRNMLLTDKKQDIDKQIETVMQTRKDIRIALDDMKATMQRPQSVKIVEKLIESDGKYIAGQDQLIKMVNAGSLDEARTFLINELRPVLVSYKSLLAELITLQKQYAQEAGKQADETYNDTRNLLIVLGIAILIFASAIGYWITVSITRPVNKALKLAKTVAAGDLTSQIEVTTKDEMGELLQALKLMNESLVRTVSTVKTGTDTIASASTQIAGGTQDLSARTEEQASSLEETASSMEELTSTVKQNAENARQANALAASASDVASKGGDVVSKVVDTMAAINESSKKISDIIGVIDGIAFQTNILALNAAVEAARAGEQGRGFAVVASEVRNLAQRSAAAAKEIKTLIGDSVEKVDAGGKLVDQAGATMQDIVESVKRVTDIMAEILAASDEQTAGIEQINQAITQMDQVTQQNAALVEEAAAASEAMQEQAGNLAQVVSVFKLDGRAGNAVSTSPSPARRSAVTAPVVAKPLTKRREPAIPHKAPKQLAPAGNNEDWEEF
ncbi:MAG TPA: methyl-accepting chemotaxis protein [Noviherbaspirillum sp.]|jgi:methyl-accepting chemotaxis protein|uniref:methyl-accepting chemotaxis protein n=1 Tax=Noviherbaspirillum sp. TaxID=1926288 RepID=UPI002DDD611E|nr:methyl-accepting chemotaxis protein [Noviherbaspirillum sp.]HEV2609815.1 methyl-accepting chemotaxis protein [Noviherbaspirillum sp.]